MEQQFKVGSVYRQRNGQIVRLHPAAWGLPASDGVVHAKRLDGLGEGHRYPTTGKEWDETMVAHNRDLIPGELTLVDGEWVGFDFKNKKDPEQQTWQEQAARHAKACEVPAPPATEPQRPALTWDKRAGRFDPFKAWRDAPDYSITGDGGERKEAQNVGFPTWRADAPAGHLLGQGVKS